MSDNKGPAVDLHIHTCYTDGSERPAHIYDALKAKGAAVVSFTDHDSVDCYGDLAALPPEEKQGGPKLIPGVELSFVCRGALRDMLGYGIRIEPVRQWLAGRYSPENCLAKQEYVLERFKEVASSQKLLFDPDIRVTKGTKSAAYLALLSDIRSHPENLERFPFMASNAGFYRHYFSNPATPFFVDETEGLPTAKEVVDLIHQAGGLAFLAHSLAYSLPAADLATLRVQAFEAGMDGLEVWHSSNDEGHVEELTGYARSHGLLMSGGSDYHGDTKPGLELITAYDNKLWTPYEAVAPWCDQIAGF